MNRPDNANLMGTFSCRKHRIGDKIFRRWKRYFWVGRLQQKRLDYFKNDQAFKCKGSIDVRDMITLSITSDRADKFFTLTVELRGGLVREFRMTSREERDRWYVALLDMMRDLQADNRIDALVSSVRQKLPEWSAELKMTVKADLTSLTELPASLVPWYVAALEAGYHFARQLSDHLRQRIIGATELETVCLIVHAASNAASAPEEASQYTWYDPVTRTLTLPVLVSADQAGEVKFTHVDFNSALALLVSSVWRDPKFEGWLAIDLAAASVRDEIAAFLRVPEFHVGLQWGHNLQQSSAAVPSYFANHVNAQLLRGVQHLLKQVCEADLRNEQSVGHATAVACLQRCITGLSITLTPSIVSRDEPPELHLEHRMWQDPSLCAAFAVTAQLPQCHESCSLSPEVTPELRGLKSEIEDIILHVRVANSCRSVEQALCDEARVRDGVTVHWERMILALCSLGAKVLQPEMMPSFIPEIMKMYHDRLHGLMEKLKKHDQLAVFSSCVCAIRIGFHTIADGPVEPGIYKGVFADHIILCNPKGDDAACRELYELPPAAVPHYPRIGVAFSVPFLTAWFKGYFAVPTNIIAAPPREVEFADDESVSEGEEEEVGEHVALERTEETKVLRKADVVNVIYDGQGSEVTFKVSAKAIEQSIDALRATFPKKEIQLHDVIRIVSGQLKHLRHLAEDTSLDPISVSRNRATLLLEAWSEFEETDNEMRRIMEHEEDTLMFERIGEIALRFLLPTEVSLAMRSRREILLIGLANTGKTLITNSLRSVPAPTLPTVGTTSTMVAFEEWVFCLKEIGGRLQFRQNWREYISLCNLSGSLHGVICVIDAANRMQVGDAAEYMEDVLSSDSLSNAPVLLVVNNCRAEKVLPTEEIKKMIDFENLVKKRPHLVVESSVTKPVSEKSSLDIGIWSGFAWLCDCMRNACSKGQAPPIPKVQRPLPRRGTTRW